MDTLQISLFGSLRVVAMPEASELQLTHSVQALLAYLILRQGRAVPREQLADLFWQELDDQRARDCLNTALWRLRSIFRQSSAKLDGSRFLVTNNLGEVGINNLSNCWLDIVEFYQLWEQTPPNACDMNQQDLKNLDRMIELYDGDLLERFDYDWILPERERYRLIYLSSLARLMDFYGLMNMPEKSLEYGQRILSVDPLREDIHRDMMKLYIQLGQRAMAIHQYKTCNEILAKELNITPMIETQRLFEQILSESDLHGGIKNPTAIPPAHASEEYGDVLRYVENATANFDQAQRDLRQALQMLNHYSDFHKHLP